MAAACAVCSLVGNSCKFTQRGSIKVTACALSDGMVEVCVSDTGMGIPEDKYDQIFMAFEQVGWPQSQKATSASNACSSPYLGRHHLTEPSWCNADVGLGPGPCEGACSRQWLPTPAV